MRITPCPPAFLLLAICATSTITNAAHTTNNHKFFKRATYSGFATWYDVGTGNAGACGDYLNENDYIVALNEPMYGSLDARSSWCGQTITISNGKTTANARVVDACPTGGGNCFHGSLDMSKSLFEHFADTGVGKFAITWWPAGSGPQDAQAKKDKEAKEAQAKAAQEAKQAQEAKAAQAAKDAQEKAQAAKKKAQAEAKAAQEKAQAEAKAAKQKAKDAQDAAKKKAKDAEKLAQTQADELKKSIQNKTDQVKTQTDKAVQDAQNVKPAQSVKDGKKVTETKQEAGNLNNFASLYDGLSNIIKQQAQA